MAAKKKGHKPALATAANSDAAQRLIVLFLVQGLGVISAVVLSYFVVASTSLGLSMGGIHNPLVWSVAVLVLSFLPTLLAPKVLQAVLGELSSGNQTFAQETRLHQFIRFIQSLNEERILQYVAHYFLLIDLALLGYLMQLTGGAHHSPFHPFLLIIFPMYENLVRPGGLRLLFVGAVVLTLFVLGYCPWVWHVPIETGPDSQAILNRMHMASMFIAVGLPFISRATAIALMQASSPKPAHSHK